MAATDVNFKVIRVCMYVDLVKFRLLCIYAS